MRIEANRYVLVDYTLKGDDGEVLDASSSEDGEPIEYVHGYGMIVPGLEAGLAGLATGEKKRIDVQPEDAFGERDEELVMVIDRSELPDPKHVEIGEEFIAESHDGDEALLRVVSVDGDDVTVDGNHELAGMTLHYEVNIKEVREATQEELELAAKAFEAAKRGFHGHDCGDDDCDHEHDEAPPVGDELISLGKKKPVFGPN